MYNRTHLKKSIIAVFFLVFMSCSTLIAAENQGWADRNRFPEAYSILTSDHIMYPDNVTDWPMKIDSKRQLFVDDYVVSSMENLTREFHQAKKHPGNPLMPSHPVAVMYDEKTRKFRMWYSLYYAESTDGIHWTKPNLGPDGNRIIKDPGEIRGFMYNPDIPEQEGRYKIVLEIRANKDTNEPGGHYIYHSRDGLKWQRLPEGRVLHRSVNTMPGSDRYWSKGVGDTSIFQYDPVLKKYTCSGKFNLYLPAERFKELGIVQDYKPRLRLRTFSESDDLIHWSSPRFILFPDKYDDPDCQIYAHIGFPYESMWMGLIRTMHVIPAGFKQTDIKLSYSRDGRHWLLRPREREPFIALGGPDSWEADYSGFTKFPPVLVGDELWFYYFGSRNGERDKLKTWGAFGIGLAKLRRDGFASLNAGDQAGKIMTRPMTFKGKKLFVNADVQKGGWIKAAVLTSDSDPVKAYELDNSVPLTKDTTQGRMTWKSKDTLVPPGDDHVKLVFELKNAKLYSFWIQ